MTALTCSHGGATVATPEVVVIISHGSPAARALCDLLPRLPPRRARRAALALVALLAEGDDESRGDVLAWLAAELAACLRSVASDLPDSRYPCEEAARMGAIVAALGAVSEDLATAAAARCADAAA